jgi:hypothetical protein
MKVGDYQERLSGNNAQVWWAICLSSCENEHQAARRGIVDRIVRGPVQSFVEADPDPGQSATDLGPHLYVVFSDPAGEDQRIHPIECGDHGRHLSFPKIPSARIRTMRQNQRIILRDACIPSAARDVCRQPVQVTAPA